MKKITFTVLGLLFAVNGLVAQTYSTGTVPFFSGGATTAYTGKIDITSSAVTLTLVGPATSWMGVGFNTSTMDSNSDVVMYNGTVLSDRHFVGFGNTPEVDAVQNWSLVSDNVASGVRTAVLSRSRVATEGGDFTFPFPPTSFNVVFARSIGSTSIGYHGNGNCGATGLSFTLGTDSFDIGSLKIFPNPATDFVVVELPDSVLEAAVLVYDMQGRKVKEANVTTENRKLDLSGLTKGLYLLNIGTIGGVGTKTLVIN